MLREMNRREAIAIGLASAASLSLPSGGVSAAPTPLIEAHDTKLERTLARQVTDSGSPWQGGFPDQWGLHHCGEAGQFLKDAAAAYFNAQSRFHKQGSLRDSMKLAADFLIREQRPSGNIDLLVTNFDSPPDTGFVVHKVGTAAKLAQIADDPEVLGFMEPFLKNAGEALAVGGIHTPNHRWVVSAALAQIHDLFPDKKYVARIDEWLAEGIDIDAEGQYIERSTAVYNSVVNHAFVVMAHKLSRPELFDPVRKNLNAMAYLLHPNGEVVTEISGRQDANTRDTMSRYWFPLRYMALHDNDGLFTSMLAPLEPEHMDLAFLMEYPELTQDLPAKTAIPDDYEKNYPLSGITRIRRGKTSATIQHTDSSRVFSLHRGDAVINAVRFASAFFGKGQFTPDSFRKEGDTYYFEQRLKGWYFQPINDPEDLPVPNDRWSRYKMKRKTSELCEMHYEARLVETANGFELSITAEGTDNVPLAIEINLREGGTLNGVTPAPRVRDAFLLKDGFAEYVMGTDRIRFGPGHAEHAYVQVRGAEGKLPGPSVYLTGYTPFQHTIRFEML